MHFEDTEISGDASYVGDVGLQEYERLVSLIPRIGQIEESRLVDLHKRGDMMARNRLIEGHLWLVLREARKRSYWQAPFDDLVQAGNVGLINCVDGYSHQRGKRLRHVALVWVYEAMRRSINDENRPIRLPQHIVEVLRKVDIRSKDVDFSGLTVEEIAMVVGETVVRTRRALRASSVRFESLSVVRSGKYECGVELDISEILSDPSDASVDEIVAYRLLCGYVRELLNEFCDARTVEILSDRYGLSDDGELTLQAIGDKFELTRERVRQITRSELRALGSHADAMGLRDYLYYEP